MRVNLFKPKSKELQKHIECFYLLKRTADEKPVTYLGFPTYKVFIAANQNASIALENNDITTRHSLKSLPESLLIFDSDKPGFCRYEGETNEITIYFKPLGLNAFLERPLSFYKTSPVSFFNPFDDYQSNMAEIFTIKNDEKMIEATEAYWLSKLRGFDHPFLGRVIAEMMDEDNSQTTAAKIAEKTGISRTTLHKHFVTHVGMPPNQFRRIVRFRSAMKRFAAGNSQENLSDISNIAEYFDQSHMIRDFKSLTGYSPKTFFAKLSQLENGQINWLFL